MIVPNGKCLFKVSCKQHHSYQNLGKSLKKKVKCLYLYCATWSATWAVLLRGPVRATPDGSNAITGGNRSTRRKPAMLCRVKLDNTLLICDKGNFNQITARSRNRTRITVVRDACSTIAPPAPHAVSKSKFRNVYNTFTPTEIQDCFLFKHITTNLFLKWYRFKWQPSISTSWLN